MPGPDAATPRGAARRDALVAAAAALLAAAGPDAVSHRAVARTAGVPLAATTYYFAGLDDLLAAATERIAAEELAAAGALVHALPRRRRSPAVTAAALVEVLLGRRRDDAELLAFYERFLATGRHPALRPVLRGTRDRVDALLVDVLQRCGRPGADVATLVAVVDGTILSALLEGDGRARERARDAVETLLRREALLAG
ncbi:TetR family transcriptional regulator [Geodermatophilus sp. TF02-6]|uniref:TetR/AcrR family transcriptional regulator n=1 Tax=Geodermatophilus sp. TF02-6 TaxID=2250575 RepID=UPI000DEA4407|nr:TetR family transcriptional regulator [Geodermatophilus sp. TF02-6]RBY77629.1 TetR family transcriptional regulator [Geodermatophilus sp. TF02-6]